MSIAKRTQYPQIEVNLLREGILESNHKVEAVVSDDHGRILAVAGDAETSYFMRSALKPFQALAVTSTGVIERYDLTDKDLAIICSSHQGQIEQARQVFNILWRADIDPRSLQCPIPEGKESPLEHNCSGKHAGMLAVCQQRDWPLDTYLNRSNPVQKLIINKIGELLGMPGDEFVGATDDCLAPTYSMSLGQMACLYAQLACGNRLNLERIVRAMTNYPEMVGGKGTFDTELMTLTEGVLVSKSGAEGIQCIGNTDQSMGLAIKVIDGAKRAKYAAAVSILRQMGWISTTVAETLAEKFLTINEYKRLEVAGELSLL